jgi:ribose transport system substrate-binding protein
MSRRWLLTAVLLMLLGCDRDAPDKTASPSSAAPAADARRRIAMSQCNLGEPWRVQMNADVKAAAEKHPQIELIFMDAQNDSLRQRAQIEELTSMKVDLIIISPKETAPLTKPVAEAYDAGIPVIVLDRRVSGDKYTAFIGADNVKIGRAAGKWTRATLGGKGKVVELRGLMTSSPGQDRHRGFRDGLALDDNPGLEVVAQADMDWLEGKARSEMESILAVHDTIDLVYAHNDPGAHGAYLAAKQAGRHQAMKLVGIDALDHEGIQYVKQGILAATFAYPTGGKEAVDMAVQILKGEDVAKETTLGTRIYTKENVEKGGAAID